MHINYNYDDCDVLIPPVILNAFSTDDNSDGRELNPCRVNVTVFAERSGCNLRCIYRNQTGCFGCNMTCNSKIQSPCTCMFIISKINYAEDILFYDDTNTVLVLRFSYFESCTCMCVCVCVCLCLLVVV